MAKNKLVLNGDKTHLLIMTSLRNHRRHGNYGITLDTGDKIIEPQDTEKLLGGFISNDLSWKENIRDNNKSLFRIPLSRINALSKVCRISDFKTRKMSANGIVISKFIYLIQLWGGCQQYLLIFLQKLQNRAARMVTKRNIYTPVRELLQQCGWLSINQLIFYHNVLQVFKTRETKRPGYLYKKFSADFGAQTRMARSNGIKINNRIKSDLGLNNFTHVAAKQWNILPITLRMSPKLSTFKSQVKTWIKDNVPIWI